MYKYFLLIYTTVHVIIRSRFDLTRFLTSREPLFRWMSTLIITLGSLSLPVWSMRSIFHGNLHIRFTGLCRLNEYLLVQTSNVKLVTVVNTTAKRIQITRSNTPYQIVLDKDVLHHTNYKTKLLITEFLSTR